ncbi:MAG: hypothetical protein KAK00_00045 [Nanoarchaeota archaeon]|nr:hypothetical protein [Nanoarchaeota archaeon]
MSKENLDISEEHKKLVLARLKTLNPELKIMLGTKNKVSIKELIKNVEEGNDFGKKVIRAQITMLKVLAGSA